MARLDEYLSMCEAGWDVNVVILSTIGVNWASESLRNFIAGKYHCSRIQSVFGIQVEQYDGTLGIFLAGKMRLIQKSYVDQFDVFIYQEDDMSVTLSHVQNYLYETRALDSLVNATASAQHNNEAFMIGFMRIHHLWPKRPYVLPRSKFDYPVDADVLVEKPKFEPICLGGIKGDNATQGAPYIIITDNTHQGMIILTRQQLKMLDSRCQYFDQHDQMGGREYVSSLAVFSFISPFIQHNVGLPKSAYCRVNKVIPFRRLQNFLSLHMFRGRHSSDSPIVNEVRQIIAKAETKNNLLINPCWATV